MLLGRVARKAYSSFKLEFSMRVIVLRRICDFIDSFHNITMFSIFYLICLFNLCN